MSEARVAADAIGSLAIYCDQRCVAAPENSISAHLTWGLQNSLFGSNVWSRHNVVYLVAEGLNEFKRRKARGCPEPRTTELSEGVRGQVIQPHAESRSDDVVDTQHRPHPGTPPEEASYPRTPLRFVRGSGQSRRFASLSRTTLMANLEKP